MDSSRMRFGLLLPNQGVVFGATTVPELLDMARTAETSGVFDTVFVGDSLLAKPRLESVAVLSAVAAVTRRVRLGTACMASFPLRHPIVLAAQWSALDSLSHGRTVLVVCIGGGGSGGQVAGDFDREYQAFGIDPSERAGRLEEGIEVLRTLWTQDPATHHGRFFTFDGISVRPRPVQRPCPPIWIANNPHVFGARPDVVRRTVERVGRLADGWMTVMATPGQFRDSWEAIRTAARANGRDPDRMESSLYYNVNVAENRREAFAETKRFLDQYYSTDFSEQRIEGWTAYGPPSECAAKIREYASVGVQTLNIRFTSYDQGAQLRRFLADVVPQI
ncbi:MAG: LLM class flavin-dependent oxidoreductase [Candidatus Rokubacteria bacterium]|nr:LLM class flavin-dependent oxidoreductase [Candidatus Rokubacteria bacterium]